jgi:hypothetical protein
MASFDTGGAVSGAGTGATIGAVGGPWGMAIGAGVGFVAGGLSGASAKNAAQKERDAYMELLKRALRQLSPRHIAKIQQQLIPLLRSSVYAAGGGNIAESVKGALSKAGLLDSPIGAAISGAAQYAPDMAAFNQSLQLALNLSTARASTLSGARLPAFSTVSPLGEAVAGGARGAFAFSSLPGRQRTPQDPVNWGNPPFVPGSQPPIPHPGPPQQSYPNLYPTPGTTSPWDF